MTEPVWVEIPHERFEDFREPFYAKFDFNPRAGGSGIVEPQNSVTIDLKPIYDSQHHSQFAAGNAAVNALALLAMTEVFPTEQRLLVLDWQHPSYWFWPHRQATQQNPAWSAFEIFPGGDYYAFLTEDFTVGTFGHPWSQTLCIFGEPLVEALVPKLTPWLPIKRRAGVNH